MLFNFGWQVYHSLIGVVCAYLICKFMGGTAASVILAFVLFMGHLLWGYWYTATDAYDILWTMPQCILAIRMIGLITDLYDGRRSKISGDTAETALKDCPSFLGIAAFTYFFGSTFVGPQFSLRRFRDFVNGHYDEPYVRGPLNRVPSLQRLFLGSAYMFGHIFLYMIYPTDYYLSEKFKVDSIFTKYVYMLIWFRIILLRYQAVWLIAEGSCILSGLAYNGRNERGEVLWDAVRNIRMVKFEFGCSFQSVIESFNYNTNQWAAKYVFKRLRFLGNKDASHVLTLLFLAVWHGFYSGYLGCFGFEFVCVFAERVVTSAYKRNNCLKTFERTPEIMFPMWFIKKLLITSGCAFGLIPFALLTFWRWIEVYSHMYFAGWWLVVVIPLFLSWLFKSNFTGGTSKRRVKENHQG